MTSQMPPKQTRIKRMTVKSPTKMIEVTPVPLADDPPAYDDDDYSEGESIDDEIAEGHARMWLNKSLNHELELRGVERHSEFQIWHNYLNITQQFGYCMTTMGFLNFEHATQNPQNELQNRSNIYNCLKQIGYFFLLTWRTV